jgi:hypothetical protein
MVIRGEQFPDDDRDTGGNASGGSDIPAMKDQVILIDVPREAGVEDPRIVAELRELSKGGILSDRGRDGIFGGGLLLEPISVPLSRGPGEIPITRGEKPTSKDARLPKRGSLIDYVKDKVRVRKLKKEIKRKDARIKELEEDLDALRKQRGIYR